MSNRGVGAEIPPQGRRPVSCRQGAICPRSEVSGNVACGVLSESTGPCAAGSGERPPRPSEKQVFRAQDLHNVLPIRSVATLPGFQGSDFPVLARDKVRYAGEQIAMAVAPTRAEAEDIAEAIDVEYEELPAIVTSAQALDPDLPLIHDHWRNNVVCETEFQNGDIETAKAAASHVVTRSYDMSRQTPMPMEGRGTCAQYDGRLDELVVWMSNQLPHPMQRGIAKFSRARYQSGAGYLPGCGRRFRPKDTSRW